MFEAVLGILAILALKYAALDASRGQPVPSPCSSPADDDLLELLGGGASLEDHDSTGSQLVVF